MNARSHLQMNIAAMVKVLASGVSLLMTVGCAPGHPRHADPDERRAIKASAPDGFSVEHLGLPFDADFQLLPGREGASLFSEAETRVGKQSTLTIHRVERQDDETLAAHASAWGMIEGRFESRAGETYLARNLVLIDDVVELDETTGLEDAADAAVYYPFRVFRGWSFEVVCHGQTTEVDSGVAAWFFSFSGSLDNFDKHEALQCTTRGRGLRFASSDALFAKTQDEVEARFESDTPVPILVEWRKIPGKSGHSHKLEVPQAGCAGNPGCEPCSEWSFSRLTWKVPSMKSNAAPWDGDDSPPDVQLRLRTSDGATVGSPKRQTFDFEWELESPLELKPGSTVTLTATDRDALFDDPMVSFNARVPAFIQDGMWKLTGGQMLEGECLHP